MDPETPDPARLDDTGSRAERLIARLKAGRLRPGQFRLVHLLVATTLLAVLMAIPRIAGVPYDEFFLVLYAVVYAFGPPLVLMSAGLFPWLTRRHRRWLAGLLLAVLFAPALAVSVWDGKPEEIPETVLATIICWLPQALCIAGVWYFLFRDNPRRRPATRRRAIGGKDDESPPDLDF